MFHRQDNLLRQGTGLAVQGALVTVYVNGTDTAGDYTNATKATLYRTDEAIVGNIIDNPLTTDPNGAYEYFIQNGAYDEVAKYGSITQVEIDIQMVDLLEAITNVATRALLAGAALANVALLTEPGREGTFVWSGANLQAQVTADTQQGLYVPPTGGDGSTGAWVRRFSGLADFRWFGSVADMTADGVGTNNTPMLDAARAALVAANKSWLHIPQQAAAYRFSTAPAAIHDGVLITGERHYQNPGQVGGTTYIGIRKYPGTVLGFAPDVPGFKLVAYTDNASNAPAFEYPSAHNSAIRDLMLYSEGGTGATSHGLELFVKASLDNLDIQGFAGVGLKISGDDTGGGGTANQYGNAINSHIQNVNCTFNKLHGFHVTGNNGSAILFTDCAAQLNGGVAFLDQGPFGNGYTGCLAATNNASFGTPAGYSAAQRAQVLADYAGLATQTNGSFVGYGGVASHTYTACYVEVGNGSYPDIGYQSVVSGGQLANYAWQFNVGTNGNPTINSGRGVDTPKLNFTTNQANSAVAFDHAQVYRHADHGLVLQGAPSAIGTYDVTIRNKADAAVMSVNTGTTTARFFGTVQVDFKNILFNGASAFPGIGITSQSVMFASATNGLNLAGWGSTYDLVLGNKTNQLALAVPTGTQDVLLFGNVKSGANTLINSAGVIQAVAMPALTGDVTTVVGTVGTTIGANRVTRAMLSAAAGATILGATGAGNVADLTAAQAKTFLAIANTDVSGLGTASTANTGTSGHTVPYLDGVNTFTGSQTVTGDVTASGGLRAKGAPTGAAGLAVDVYSDGANGIVQAYNSTSTAYANLFLKGLAINFYPNGGSQMLSVNTTGIILSGTQTVGAAVVFNSAGVLQAAAFPALTGDVTTAAGALATTIANGAVTVAKMANLATVSLLGNPTGGAAAPSAITLAGGLSFSGSTLTAAGALTPTSVAATGAIKSSGAGGVGYATGSGGAVIQATSKSTGVTLNKDAGQITMNAAALAATTSVAFTLTDSEIAATDVVLVTIASGATTGSYIVQVEATAAGSCRIQVRNISAGSLSEAIVLNFAIIKAVAA